MDKEQTIVMTGFMGSGKSAVGKRLAVRMQLPFRDLDKVIEAGEGQTISQIFSDQGEARFRELERDYFEKILRLAPMVLALGGGAVQQPSIFEYICRHAVMVYLNVPPEVLFDRLKKDSKRPLLHDQNGRRLSDPELCRRITDLLQQREPLYRKAHVIVDVRPGWTTDETANELYYRLKKHVPSIFPENHGHA